MRSCSSPVLVQEAAEQVASTYPALLICHADGGQTDAWVRRFQPKRLVRAMLVAGSARGAVLAFRRARFPGPPSEPACRSSWHRALHEARHQQTVALPLGSAVPGLDCQPGRRYSPTAPALPTRHRRLAVPFAMCTPLACSDYYGHSATTRHQQPTTHLPTTPRREGRRRVASHVHHHPVDEVGAQRSPGSLARGTPQPFPLASPTGHYPPAAESPAATAAGVHC
jgi:hypothetical protein